MPKFSIIIPTYKRLSLLKKALLSVQNQKFDDFECLVINSYPADNNMIDSIKSELDDNRFVFFKSDKELNGNQARNIGIKRASADYIAFLDDDDIWYPEKLTKHFEFHEKTTSIGLVFSNSIKKWEGDAFYNVIVPTFVPDLKDASKYMLSGSFCPPTSSAVTVKRVCFEKIGVFDENLISFQDWDMWYRLSKEYRLGYLNDCLVVFYQHKGLRTSQSTNKRLKGLKDLVYKHKISGTGFKNIFLLNTYADTAFNLILLNKKLNSAKWIVKIFLLLNKKAFIRGFKLLFLAFFGLKTYETVKSKSL